MIRKSNTQGYIGMERPKTKLQKSQKVQLELTNKMILAKDRKLEDIETGSSITNKTRHSKIKKRVNSSSKGTKENQQGRKKMEKNNEIAIT